MEDVTFAIIRCKLKGHSITVADREHLHHRLLDAGLSQKQAVLWLYGTCACFGIAAVLGAFLITILMRRTALLTALSRKHGK